MGDIESRTHLEELVKAFYQQALVDPQIGHLFDGLDLEHHIPVIVDFWDSVVFRTATYRGGLMYKHLLLNQNKPLEAAHFLRWLELFGTTTDALYSGPRADLVKGFAQSVARTMQERILGTGLPLAGKPSS
jgi:hemoglobin